MMIGVPCLRNNALFLRFGDILPGIVYFQENLFIKLTDFRCDLLPRLPVFCLEAWRYGNLLDVIFKPEKCLLHRPASGCTGTVIQRSIGGIQQTLPP